MALVTVQNLVHRRESRNNLIRAELVDVEASMGNDKIPNDLFALGRISEALIASGYTSLDKQAKALGVHRSTAWVIIKNKHKLGRLSAKTAYRILNNPQTPPAVRTIVQQYMTKRSARKLRLGCSLKELSQNKK
jgi:plasmid maintenance system antidote protein VapI